MNTENTTDWRYRAQHRGWREKKSLRAAAQARADGHAQRQAWRATQPSLDPSRLVIDKLSCHKRSGVRAAIEKAGCELRFLPPYSPKLNPIEHAFSKLKAKLRAAAKRTVEALWHYLGEVLDEFSPAECRNFIASCGYSAATLIQEPR